MLGIFYLVGTIILILIISISVSFIRDRQFQKNLAIGDYCYFYTNEYERQFCVIELIFPEGVLVCYDNHYEVKDRNQLFRI